MNKSDIGTIGIIYATCAAFLYMTLQLKPAAQIYPLCLIAGLAILNTLYLGKCLIRLAKARNAGEIALHNDFPEIFKDFLSSQFFFIVIACIAYIILLFYLGFYLSSLIYLVGVMCFLRVKPLPLILTTIVLGLLIYGVFTVFLKVPLPKGIIFS